MRLPAADLRHERRHYYATIAMLTMLISGFAIDIYTPSLPAVAEHFDVLKGQVQFTITAYLLGFGITQLIAGSMSESFGRRWTILGAIIVFTVLCLLTTKAQSILQLQTLRCLQGVCVAFMNVSARAILSDLYSDADFYRVMNYATIFWAIGPIIAPAIGGYLQHYIGWEAAFYFLAIYSCCILVFNIIFLPETIKQKTKFDSRFLLTSYKELLSNLNYVLGIFILGAIYGMLVLFGVVGPFLIQNVMGYTPVAFGHMALLMGLAWFFGNIANRLLMHIQIHVKVRLALTMMLIVTITMLLVGLNHTLNIYDIIIPLVIVFFLGGMIFPNYFAQNVALFKHIAAQANGLMGASVLLISGIASSIGIMLRSHTQIPLTIAYIGIAFICLVSAIIIKHQDINQHSHQQSKP